MLFRTAVRAAPSRTMTQLQQTTSKVPIHRLPAPGDATAHSSARRSATPRLRKRRSSVFPAVARRRVGASTRSGTTGRSRSRRGARRARRRPRQGRADQRRGCPQALGPTDVLDDAEGGLKVLSSKHRLSWSPRYWASPTPRSTRACPSSTSAMAGLNAHRGGDQRRARRTGRYPLWA
jgi:hypothetical protein